MSEFKGLSSAQVEESRKKYGTNAITQKEQETLFQKIIEGFKDPTIVILLVALTIQFVMFIMGRGDVIELVGIGVAILIANFVGVLSENSQQLKAAALRAEALAKERVKVYRDGVLVEIGVNDVVVGDMIVIQSGDKIPVEGILLSGSLKVDQAALNGESDEAKKRVLDADELGDTKDFLNPFYVFRGSVVTDGEAILEAKQIGDNTVFGQIYLALQDEQRETPLKVKLSALTKQITKFGYFGAIIIFCSVLAQTLLITKQIPGDWMAWVELLTNAVSFAVVIIVMAVPEGLPMMISLVLAMNMGKMMKDNVLVQKLHGIETAGSLSLLFSDKTGTITEGKLAVIELVTGNITKFKTFESIHSSLALDIIRGIGLNNSANASDGEVIGGNPTDKALLSFLIGIKRDRYIDKKEAKVFNAFNSSKKSSSVVISENGETKTYIKGAPERILDKCKYYLDEKGEKKLLVEKNELTRYMNEQAGRCMRLLGVAVSDSELSADSEEKDLTLVCLISIRDNVRAEVVQAIQEVQAAGVQVVMATGDRKETAVAIAKEAGLLTSPEHISLTSQELGEKSDEEIKKLLPNLRVVARAQPTDKSRLVRLGQELNLVVGMTGDGVNDSPALKLADVGFAMGSGTEVAKEAAEITIMDDNFVSITKAILYGRTIFKNIRKFLIFQLTVNVSTVALCFLAPLLGISQPLSIVSILYINLVMDTLAALAFGLEPALTRYMHEKPVRRDENILSKTMVSQILSISTYIVVVSLLILLMPSVIALYHPGSEGLTSVEYKESAMLAFMMMTVMFNGFYARTEGLNVFENITENKMFITVMCAVAALLFLLIMVIGRVAGLVVITGYTWFWMFLFASLSILVDIVRKTIVAKKN